MTGTYRVRRALPLLVAMLVGVAVLIPSPARAQDRNRVYLDTADDEPAMIGEFEDLNRGIVYIRVSLHDQRRVPIERVAFINFEGKAAYSRDELALAMGPHHLLILKDGTPVKGRLVNIEGGAGSQREDQPRIVSFRDEDGRVGQFRMADLARLS